MTAEASSSTYDAFSEGATTTKGVSGSAAPTSHGRKKSSRNVSGGSGGGSGGGGGSSNSSIGNTNNANNNINNNNSTKQIPNINPEGGSPSKETATGTTPVAAATAPPWGASISPTTDTVGTENNFTTPSTGVTALPPSYRTFCKLLPFTQMTVTVYIPTVSVGAVIGRRGSTIAQIQKQAQQLATSSASGSGGNNFIPHETNQTNPNTNQVRVSIVGHHATARLQGGIVHSNHDLNPNSFSNSNSNGNDVSFLTDYASGAATATSPSSSSSPPNHTTLHHGSNHNSNNHHNNNNNNSSHSTTTVIPYTYTELDFSNPQWTPVVIRADPAACLFVAQSILDLCIEYVLDRKQLVYIFDLPVPAVPSSSSTMASTGSAVAPTSPSKNRKGPGGSVNNVNVNSTAGGNKDPNNSTSTGSTGSNRHATVVGKRGQTIMQLSSDHQCRIMVPPKQLQHDVIQLEGPLQECVSCLHAIAMLWHRTAETAAASTTTTTVATTATPTSSNSNNIATTNTTTTATTTKAAVGAVVSPSSGSSGNKKGTGIDKDRTNNSSSNSSTSNSNNTSNNSKPFEITLIVHPLPSQQRLRNIARKTDTVIKKKRIGPEPSSSSLEAGLETGGNASGTGGGSVTGNNGDDTNTVPSTSAVPWQLTILAPTEAQALSAQVQLQKSTGIDTVTLVTTNVTGAAEIAVAGPNAKEEVGPTTDIVQGDNSNNNRNNNDVGSVTSSTEGAGVPAPAASGTLSPTPEKTSRGRGGGGGGGRGGNSGRSGGNNRRFKRRKEGGGVGGGGGNGSGS